MKKLFTAEDAENAEYFIENFCGLPWHRPPGQVRVLCGENSIICQLMLEKVIHE